MKICSDCKAELGMNAIVGCFACMEYTREQEIADLRAQLEAYRREKEELVAAMFPEDTAEVRSRFTQKDLLDTLKDYGHAIDKLSEVMNIEEERDSLLALLREILTYLDRSEITHSQWYKVDPNHVAKMRAALAHHPAAAASEKEPR